ncbi:MAG: hypothetical protein GY863_17370 [bacterium]|nr:hypothetical protein [bacterium]
MNTNLKNRGMIIFLTIVMSIFLINVLASAQDKKTDNAELFSEVAGSWEFDAGGRLIPFWLIVEDGKLYLDIKVEGIDPEEMIQDKEDKMKFETIANGLEAHTTFIKDDDGKITGCKIYYPDMDQEFEGVKLDDGEF